MNNASDFDDAAAVVANNPQASAPLDTAGSAFDAAAQDVAGGARTTVRTNMLSASEHSPDDYAKAKQLGAQTGVPTDIAARNMPELKKQSDMAKYDSLFETSPKLANAFQLPDFAHLANDDVHALSGIEDAAKPQQRSIGESLVNMPYSLLQGLGLAFNKTAAGLNLTAGAAPVIYDKLVGGTSAQDWWFSRMVDPLLDQRKALEPDEQARFPEKAMHTAGDLLGMLSTITLGGTAAEGPALAATAGARETVGAAVEHGTKAMLIPAVAESIDTGRKVYEATGDASAAIRASQMAYLTTTLGGIVPLSVPGNLATRMATGAVSGVVTGETSRELMNNSLPDQMKSPFDWENTALSAIAGSVLAVGGPRGESSKAYDAIRETYVNAARADKAEVDATALQKISAFAANSALRERDPDSFKKFVADVTEDGHLENVYIKADVLEQALLKGGVDENELRQKMPDVFAQLAEARETQGDVRIPVADYATHIAGGKADAEILPNLKTEPDGMTYLQSQEYQQTQKAELTEQAKQILAQKEADTAFKESAARVEEKLRADFDAANRFGPSINAEYSKLAAAMYTTQAARMGLTPEQMHERYPLNIRSDAVEGTPGVDQAGAPSNGIVSRVRRALDAMYNTVPEEHKSRPETEGVATMLKRGYDAFRAEPPAPQAFRDGRSGGGVTFEQGLSQERSVALNTLTRERNNQAILLKSFMYGARLSPEQERDVFERIAKAAESDSFFSTPAFSAMLTQMRRAIHDDPQVVDAIVGAVPVDVVNNLFGSESAAKVALHDEAMLKNSSAFDAQLPVAEGVDAANPIGLLVRQAALETAKMVKASADAGVKSLEGVTALLANQRNSFSQGEAARARLSFGDDITEGATISLLQRADLSSFNHELGHFYLEVLTHMANNGGPPEVRGDMNALMTWFRTDLDSWNAMELEQKRLMHEKFARGFEAYLFEGKAPSAELTSLFGRMRAWMIAVYKQISALNVRLTDEVRGVYDRMLAADDQIRQAEATRGMFAMFDNKPPEMSDEQWVKYREESQNATAEAVSEVQRKSLADMKWLSNAKNKELRRIQKEANGARDAITEQVTAEVAKEPIYAAETWFRKGEMTDPATGDLVKAEKGFKLDSEKIAEMFPETMNSRPDLEPLKGMTGKNGLDPDLAAEMFGFRDGHQLVGELLNKVPREEIIQGMTDQRMLEEHGEMSDPTSIQRAAEAAIHNKVRARLIATELKAVAKGMGSARAMLKGATEAAEAAIAQRRIRDLRPDQHEAAEARAAKAALAAHKAADTVAAVDAKRAQLLNNRLTRASMDALDDVKKGLDYQAKFDKPTVRENIDLAFRDQIDALRNRFDFRSSMSPEAAAASRRQSLGNFVEKLAAMKFSLDVPQNLLDAANRKHFKDMTVEEFRGLIDTIKSLEHLGRAVQKITDGTESRNVNDVAAEAQDAASKLPQRKDETNRGLSLMSSKWMKAKSYGRSIQASLLKMEQMIDWLDNYNSNGVFNRMTFQKIAKAEGARNDLDLKITKRWADAIEKMPKDVFKNGREVLEMPGVKDSLTGENQRLTWHEKIALAGIRGDAEHFAKLMKGEKWDASAVLDFLDKNVSKEEWTFVHDISQTFAELFPMKTAMLRDLGSTPPKAVAHIPFKTPHGDQPGWYWPISYDPHRNYTVKERGARHEASLFEDNIFTRADTSTGREETRNENYAKPMLLSIDALPRVLKDEIRDITTRKAIIEADRFVSHPVVRDAISRALSPEHYDQFNSWLLSLANDAAVKPGELQMWDRLAHGLRTRATMVGLGFRLSTMVQHGLTAAGESIAEAGPKAMIKGTFNSKTMAAITTLGPKWMEKGIANFIRSDQFEANRDFIFERSDEMRHRANEFERDVREQLREINIKLADPTTRAITRAKLGVMARAYSGISMLDMASALPTWMGGYLKAMEKVERGGLGMTEEQAVYFADKTVRNAHGGGGIKDMAAIQRGGEFMKLFTMFYTFWNHNVNRLIDTGKRVGELPGGIRAGTVTTGDVGTLVLRTFMYTLGVQAIHGMMHPPKDGEEDSWLKWIGKALGQAAFGGIPILRDFSNHYLGGKDYEASPIASLAQSGDAVLKDMEGTAKTKQYIKHAMTTAGYIFGLPTGQAAATSQFLSDVWDGQQNPRDIAEWWQGISTGKVHH